MVIIRPSKSISKVKVIFLDIDGVLNGYSWWTPFVYPILSKLCLLKKVNKYYNIFGVRTYRVFLLSIITKITGAKIVMSSSWRGSWFTPYEKCPTNMKTLKDKLKKFKVEVIDITPTISTKRTSSDRGVEIQYWLDHAKDKGYEVESFVILDDEQFDLTEFKGKGLIITSRNGEVKGHWSENTRLKPRHVIRAIKILNKNHYKEGFGMYADKKKPKYKLFLTIGWAACAVLAFVDLRIGIGLAMLVPAAAFIHYATSGR